MKNLILSLVAALCCSASLFAEELQEELVATLNHKGTLTAYYGETAFAEAMENADHGDEITLSGGTFKIPDHVTYNKAVTIRGAGWKDNATKKTLATNISINGSYRYLHFNLSSEVDAKLFIEGVCFPDVLSFYVESSDLAEATISKCRVDGTLYCNGSLLHVYNGWISSFDERGGYADIQNTVIGNWSSTEGPAKAQHCWIGRRVRSPQITLQDCLIGDIIGVFPYGSTVINCLFGEEVDLTQANHQSCYMVSNIREILVDEPNTDKSTYKLTDEAKSLYPASDGTEIGIYGGEYPYTDEVGLPLVTKLILGNRTSAGKLPVTIEVK